MVVPTPNMSLRRTPRRGTGNKRYCNASSKVFTVINLSRTYYPVLFLIPLELQWSDAVPNQRTLCDTTDHATLQYFYQASTCRIIFQDIILNILRVGSYNLGVSRSLTFLSAPRSRFRYLCSIRQQYGSSSLGPVEIFKRNL
jgi:hypothetical protein